MNCNGEYSDIINLPHHVSKKHPQMSIEERAAQFGAFDALTGLKSIINQKEQELKYVERIELSEEKQEEISDILQISEVGNYLKITYYCDGEYKNIKDRLKKLDPVKKKIILENDVSIKFIDIFDMEIL